MLRIVAIALLSFAAALITAAQEKTDASADKSMILALESPRIKRKFTPTPARQRPFIADTFITIDHHGVILNRSQDLAGLKDLSFKPEEIVQLRYQVYLYGDVAIATRVYRTKGTDSGKPCVHRGRFTDIWIKRNGEWKCIADREILIH